MKKTGAFILVFLLLFSIMPFALSAEGDDCTIDDDCDTGETCSDGECSTEGPNCLSDDDCNTGETCNVGGLCIDETPTTTSTTTTPTPSVADDYDEKIEKAYECLEEEVDDDCSDADTVQELALTILATPDNVFDECVEELKDKESGDHFGSVRDTALAILALDHAGEDTSDAEEWLLEQNITANDLTWYLQQDSNEAVECSIQYDGDDYTIDVNENKKIENSNTGTCLSRAKANFWLKIKPSCYDEEFAVSCSKDFIATLLYENTATRPTTYYILDQTESAPGLTGTIKLNVRSQCFPSAGNGNSCNYEATAWAALALRQTNHEIEDLIPYIVALADSNKQYLPNAFIYAATDYQDYASELIVEQKIGNFWEAPASQYSKYYDTALAILSLSGSSAEQVTNARNWLLFPGKQGQNGCWQNSIRDTAMVLWALEGRGGRSSGGGGTTLCSEANFFCIPNSECPTTQTLGNYFCSGLSTTCCEQENLQSCTTYDGGICASDEICLGDERRATDTDECCIGECAPRPQESQCEDMGYICRDSCSDNQEGVDYTCDTSSASCCRAKTATSSSKWWLWILLILILAILIFLAWRYRDKLKLYWFQLKSKFKKDKGKGRGGPITRGPRPGMPPRPGFPPIRRVPIQRSPQVARSTDRRDKAMGDVFQKLKDMSK
jgi:hypothetical protein